ncbi:TadE/TadG family type IV pilus assembly protein [Allomesorhizobium camelthorni]|uniref:Pilus assembly protein n=1 Tax=Allomesorhizobium camelthorni TaxID=475069 RepID=A0A6G4WB91_9HYPH|nr:TadE/TadG family type IV pilus assembly protein [Mesorhizobium camelthorni]NGO52031.1 pilus assembly protein [Mesorhizobium camelthorni]
MSVRAGAQTAISRLTAGFARLIPDRRGVAAVEFALIVPLLLSMYFVTMEVGQGIEANRKVSRIGSMVADLITQQPEITPAELAAILKIGESILQPYNRSAPKIVVTAIDITTGSEVKVAWSGKLEGGVYSKDATAGTLTTVPATLKIPGTFLIRVDSYLNYEPLITWSPGAKSTLGLLSAFDNISMKETYYLRPRMSQTVKCETC